MKNKIAKWKLGLILFAFVAVCAKIAKATWYDVTSKLSIFSSSDHQNNHSDDPSS